MRLIYFMAIGFSLMASAAGSKLSDPQSPMSALIQLEALHPGVPYWSHRRRGIFRNKNLRGLRSLHLDLSRFDFSGSDLRAADFTGSILEGVNFSGCDLREAVFVSTRERGAQFSDQTKLPFDEAQALQRGWKKLK